MFKTILKDLPCELFIAKGDCMLIGAGIDDARLQHICYDKCLTTARKIFNLLFEVILGFSVVTYNLGVNAPSIFVWSKKHEYDFDRCISK